MTKNNIHPYNEAGRRIKAALLSYQLGRAGVDRTLKEVPQDAGDEWAELAKELLIALNDRTANGLIPPRGPIRIQ